MCFRGILKGIAEHARLKEILVFEGGTVLKKIYFEDYRFSEDLDFTLTDSSIKSEQIWALHLKSENLSTLGATYG